MIKWSNDDNNNEITIATVITIKNENNHTNKKNDSNNNNSNNDYLYIKLSQHENMTQRTILISRTSKPPHQLLL